VLGKIVVLAFVGVLLGGCRPTSSAVDARQIEPEVDATPPPPHADPTPAAVQYFSDIGAGLDGIGLVSALHTKLTADHVSISFDGLWTAYETLDTDRGGCTGIFDFYSGKCWTPEEACGNFAQEGDCFNREHSWPKSWWGGGTAPDQHEDLVAVVPADGYVNGLRADDPLGEVISANYVSSNGSMRGICNVAGTEPGSRCFEPPDNLKGDFARIYFYMAVRYEGDFPCCDEVAVQGSDILPWQETMLRQWHATDTVDIDERERNERLFDIQKNRNPFVDYPEFVDRIADF
jgi:endonuclease I